MTQKDFSSSLHTLNTYCKKYLTNAKKIRKTLGSEEREKVKQIKQLYKICTAHLKEQEQETTATPFIPEEDIDPTSFVNACLGWRTKMLTFLDNKITSHTTVKIGLSTFQFYLKRNQSTIPITKILYAEWVAVVDQLAAQEDTTTGKILFEALRDHSGEAWTTTGNAEKLSKHYKDHRKPYKKINAETEGFRLALLPEASSLEDAFKASISKEDPNLPENQEKAEREAKAELEQMRLDWKNWLNRDVVPALEDTDTSTEGKLIDVTLLEQNSAQYLTAPDYAKAFWQATSDAILNQAKALDGTPSYDQVRVIAIKTVI